MIISSLYSYVLWAFVSIPLFDFHVEFWFWPSNPKYGIWRPIYQSWIKSLCKSGVGNAMSSKSSLSKLLLSSSLTLTSYLWIALRLWSLNLKYNFWRPTDETEVICLWESYQHAFKKKPTSCLWIVKNFHELQKKSLSLEFLAIGHWVLNFESAPNVEKLHHIFMRIINICKYVPQALVFYPSVPFSFQLISWIAKELFVVEF